MPESTRVPSFPATPSGPAQGTLKTSRRGRPRYAELHCITNFSFLEGASHPDELVERAGGLGYEALAITDRNSLAGVVRADTAAKAVGLKLIIGAEITLRNALSVVLLAPDRPAYGRLARIITNGRRRAPKGGCELYFEDLVDLSTGLLACVLPSRPTEDSAFDKKYLDSCQAYGELFGDRSFLLAELHHGANDKAWIDYLVSLSQQAAIPLVAAGGVHYHDPQRMELQHVLTAIKYGLTVAQLGTHRLPNAERHLRTKEEIQTLYSRIPAALHRTIEIADRCTFTLSELRYEYPKEIAPPGMSPMQYLHQLTWRGARQRYGEVLPEKIVQQLEHELALIDELQYEAFFLTVYDIVRFARAENILCQGRGSAANSSVCYCLGVTAVDPLETDLLFERFVSRERNEAPDIDVDFEHERREEVLQYVYQKYGRQRAGIAAEVITYRPRSAIREVGKALGFSEHRTDSLAKILDVRDPDEKLERRCREVGLDPESRLGGQLVRLTNELIGFPRHLSQHVGGMVVTQGCLCELVPIENAAMPDRTVIQWDKTDLAALGILKVDCLALGMLTAIHKCFQMVVTQTGRVLSIDNIPREDQDVYDMISRAETVGVFQIESRAQMSMLPRLRPAKFYDLVIQVAIVRPGPIQGNMVHPYLRRRNGEEVFGAEWPNEQIRKVLERTLGVPLFQEQAMQLAIVAAGFTPGEADQLRRAMGAWRRVGVLEPFYRKLVHGMLGNGYSKEYAEQVFQHIRGFGEYGFPESHAASFARLAYVSAWLKFYYPAAFLAALLNSQPMGFYAPAQLVQDARKHGVEVRPVDVNASDWCCTLEPVRSSESGATQLRGQSRSAIWALRLGMRLVRGLTYRDAQSLVQARVAPYQSMADLAQRANLGRSALEKLAYADAFQSLSIDRRNALWQALGEPVSTSEMPLFGDQMTALTRQSKLPGLTEQEEVFADYHATGLTLRQHPMSFLRSELSRRGVVSAENLQECEANDSVKVAGMVLLRQRPSTAKGITFVTLEDETGSMNAIVKPAVWKRYERIATDSQAWIVQGKIERHQEVVHIVVRSLESLVVDLEHPLQVSREFH
ncbi:MAG: error-prone DNA polymerase [Planctomycetaceae bacterium]|nr:error-prone DNA polymerase [Planctomycetaceae bacterium]